ncbi:DUF5719 family protein [Streptomyces hydrogenans]|uniref:Secreted protein n=1 Tax=Streptomyces hydrogenans TaxID=1873719 RepID=A0ABQ3P6N6_9ACTN|nr:DUF5719 family protein [Streptomyces hydrogenans]GHG38584.1 hypothetical protein GCM10018784_60390 [Streptomyces hydrogenans]GHI20686.1 hypothetical protein Shyd_20570 [Streptomyces hydrogenans]
MKRTTLSLIAVATALAAVTGFAALTAPGEPAAASATAAAPKAARLPVERTSLLCPAPSASEIAETLISSYTPPGTAAAPAPAAGTAAAKPTAVLGVAKNPSAPAGKKAKAPRAPASVTAPGKPVSAAVDGAVGHGLTGTATGTLAPGWTVQQTTLVPAGAARGLLGVNCAAPDTDFWFPAASTAKGRADYIHLTNPDDTLAVADIELYGPEGELKTAIPEGVQVPPHSTVPVLLGPLLAEGAQENLTAHVTTRTGRVGAALGSAADGVGSDWLAASADPAARVVLPGIPGDATGVRLVAFAPGEADADLKIQLVTANGTIVPTAAESLHVKSGMTASVDLPDLTRGAAASLLLTPTDPKKQVPVVAALRVVRGKGSATEMAFVPAAAPVTDRATVADNRAKGSALTLTAPEGAAQVKVTASAGTEGGSPATRTVSLKAGTTTVLDDLAPKGVKGTYAVTVEPVAGGGPVYAARTLTVTEDGIPMFTVQTLVDDRGTVQVPTARQDLTVLDD